MPISDNRPTYSLEELRQMDEAQALSFWKQPQRPAEDAPGLSWRNYCELRREGHEDPEPCALAKLIAAPRT